MTKEEHKQLCSDLVEGINKKILSAIKLLTDDEYDVISNYFRLINILLLTNLFTIESVSNYKMEEMLNDIFQNCKGNITEIRKRYGNIKKENFFN